VSALFFTQGNSPHGRDYRATLLDKSLYDKASSRMPAAYRGHMKVSIFIFVMAMLAAGSVVAEEKLASFTPTFATSGFNVGYGNQIARRASDQRIIDRFVSFDSSHDGGSRRYSLSLDLEHEDSDWSFEVTVTMEF
jgi:hypothetical protein